MLVDDSLLSDLGYFCLSSVQSLSNNNGWILEDGPFLELALQQEYKSLWEFNKIFAVGKKSPLLWGLFLLIIMVLQIQYAGNHNQQKKTPY